MDVRRSFYLVPRSKSVAVAQMYDGEAVWPDSSIRTGNSGLLCRAVTATLLLDRSATVPDWRR